MKIRTARPLFVRSAQALSPRRNGPFTVRPVCQAIALLIATTSGAAHAGLANLAHIASPTSGGMATTGLNTFNASGHVNLAQPRPPQQSIVNLGRAAAALSAQIAAQQAAATAAAATPSTLPNGLAAGGLQALAGGTWTHAGQPTQTMANGQTTVTIQQTAPQSVLDWQTFNIGRQTTLDFDQQGNTTWSVMNRVFDPTGVPSQILGSIKAPGQVFVINHNGIIFGAGSQVNTGALIASSAALDPAQFTASGIYSTQTNSVYTPSFTNAGGAILVAPGAQISTNVPGAVTAGGGYVLLMGSSVSNQGVIVTPGGQAALAAGDDFVIRPGYSTTGNQTSTTRGNEIAVELNAGSSSGTVTNTGILDASTGDITLVGHAVTQGGIALATTSVNARGTIHLLNSVSDASGSVTLTPDSTTAIVIDPDSGTALDSQRAALVADSATQNAARQSVGQFDDLSRVGDLEDESRIEIVTGGIAEFQGNSLTLATGGQIAVTGTRRVQVDTGATLDVSGSNVTLPMSANQIIVNVQGNEQRDSPQNRDGTALSNSNVYVDAQDLIYVPAGTGGYATDRYYTGGGLFEVGGYLSTLGHTIGEWTSAGGTITLTTGANGAVVAQSGSKFNLAGGTVQYQAGELSQSWLLGVDGHIYNVNTAPADIAYLGLYHGFVESHPRWGITKDWNNPLIAPLQIYQAGYTIGKDAGSLILSTPTAIFDGDIDAEVATGQSQQTARPDTVTDSYLLTQGVVPRAASLSLGSYLASGLGDGYDTTVVIGNGTPDSVIGGTDPIPADRGNTAYLDVDRLDSEGLGGLNVATRGPVSIGAPLALLPGGEIEIISPSVDIAANVTVRGGDVTVTNILHPAAGIDRAEPFSMPALNGVPAITLEGTIDTRGIWTNGLLDPLALTGLALIDGGNVVLDSTGSVAMQPGSAIDASSGGAVLAGGRTQGGKGGDISLVTNDYSLLTTSAGFTGDAPLVLGGTLAGYGFEGGGTLRITAPSIVLSDTKSAPVADTDDGAAGGVTVPAPIFLTPGFFTKGFSSYDVLSFSDMTVTPGTSLAPTVPVYRFDTTSNHVTTGSDPAVAATLWLPPTYTADPIGATLTQRAGADLVLGALDSFSLGQGASIAVDPLHNIEIDANNQTTIDGRIAAPGGTIAMASLPAGSGGFVGGPLGNGSGNLGTTRSLWIGSTGVLDVSGHAVTAIDTRGRVYGTVPAGGQIDLGEDNGVATTDAFVVIRPGAQLNADGASALLDLTDSGRTVPVNVASDGGTIALFSNSGIYIDGTLHAQAGGAGASGGTLSLDLVGRVYGLAEFDNMTVPDYIQHLRDTTLTQHDQATGLAGGLAPGAADPALLFGTAAISADQVQAGGFASLSLQTSDFFVFDGDFDLSMGKSLQLKGGMLSVDSRTSDAQIALAAPYVRLDGWSHKDAEAGTFSPDFSGGGNSVSPAFTPSQSSLTISGDLIDIYSVFSLGGNVGRQGSGDVASNQIVPDNFVAAAGFNAVTFNSTGDIRLGSTVSTDGTVNPATIVTGGNLAITAAQLYPMSGASGIIQVGEIRSSTGTTVYDPKATLTIRSSGGEVPAVPDSVFGSLTLDAGVIDQGGVVRAPLGVITMNYSVNRFYDASTEIFRAGSLTSVSANGLTMPFGGTTDGVTYSESDGTFVDLGSALVNSNGSVHIPTGILISGASIIGEAGAVLDLSGGGNLTGEGFISGRGGSVDVLKTPLINANPNNRSISSASDKVYAIVPSYTGRYAPVISDKGAGDPAIGQQITLTDSVGGLPAGTYTLLPSSYALLPGAYRVEIGGTQMQTGQSVQSGGSWVSSGYLGVSGTAMREALPSRIVLSSADTVRTMSQYNEMSYSDFGKSQAAQFDNVRPRLPEDGKILELDLTGTGGAPLSFAGTALFGGTGGSGGGIDGTLMVFSGDLSVPLDITAPGAAPLPGAVSISSADLDAFRAPTLLIGGGSEFFKDSSNGTGSRIYFQELGSSTLNVLDGATLTAGQVFLVADSVTVENGATIDTIGQSENVLDSNAGYVFGNVPSELVTDPSLPPAGPAVLAVANGYLDFLPFVGTSSLTIESGATLLTDGSIVLAAPGQLSVGDVNLGARYLTVSQNEINVGSDASLAAANAAGIALPGWNLTQGVLDKLLKPSPDSGAPALEQLTLTAGGSINFIGSVSLDTTGQSASDPGLQLVINTPAIYGLGGAGDVASLITGTLVWNGVRAGDGSTSDPYASATPTPVAVGGPGTGTGTFEIDAKDILFGYGPNSRPQVQTALDRVALGFSNVDLNASHQITANSNGTLSVGQSRATEDGTPAGGNLLMTTPLLTGDYGSTMSYNAAGELRLGAPAGMQAADTSSVAELGGTVTLSGQDVMIDSAVALPSGKLTLNATNDIDLGRGAVIDMSGRAISADDVTIYSWGGAISMQSSAGDIDLQSGSIIDVSAHDNAAGSLTATAVGAGHGNVTLAGTLRGAASDGYAGGQIGVGAQNLGDFAALNTRLNDGGFFDVRSFDIKQGDLVVGNEVKASSVSISVDGGSLTVDGKIDASGAAVGTIRLGARDNLTLTGNAVLDTHGTVLQTDSYRVPIDADNTPHVELTSSNGVTTLADGATIDMRSADNVARGLLTIDVPRLGGVGGDGDGANDLAVDARGHVVIQGAASIALDGFRNYSLPGGSDIDQAFLDTIDQANRNFINAAWSNADLQGRVAGLAAYGPAYHLRPGVQISSDGDLTVEGDIDLSGYRYGPNANASVRGSGEPGVLIIRTAGNLEIAGSITDGFAPPPGTPDDGGWLVLQAGLQSSDVKVSRSVVLGAGSTFPVDSVLGYAVPILGASRLPAGTPAPNTFTLPQDVILPAGWVVGVAIQIPYAYDAGTTLTATVMPFADVTLQADWTLTPGSPEAILADSLGGLDVLDASGNLIMPFPQSGATIPKGSRLPANDPFAVLAQGLVVPADVFPHGIPAGIDSEAAGTVLATSITLKAGTQIPAGFSLPDTITTTGGAAIRANATLPTLITLGADIVVNTAFTALGPIVTPAHTFAPGDSVPAGTLLPFGTTVAAGNSLPFSAPVTSMVWPAGDPLVFTNAVAAASNIDVGAGAVIPKGSTVLGSDGSSTTPLTGAGRNWAVAPMLAPGSQSWSMTFVAGADLAAADTHILQSSGTLAGSGNLILNDPHFDGAQFTTLRPSVLRTGTGDLALLAGGNFVEDSPYGVYTAGTAIAGTGTAQNDAYDVGRADVFDGTVLGGANAAYEATLNAQRMYYTENGGDFLLVAQGNISGNLSAPGNAIGDWLWRQGGAGIGQATAWGINFGSYVADQYPSPGFAPVIGLAAFTGVGALGGGNVTINAGGDIGDNGAGLIAAVGGSGRVLPDGSLVQTGGGHLSVTAGGSLGTGGNLFTDLRGNTTVEAGSVGTLGLTNYGYGGSDPRPLSPLTAYGVTAGEGASFAPGDGTVDVRSRGDLAMGQIIDPGRIGVRADTLASVDGQSGQGATWFTLWTASTAVDMFSAGGNLTPLASDQNATLVLPSILRATAPGGSIYLEPAQFGGSYLMPSPNGQLDLLAGNMIVQYGSALVPFGPLTTSLSALATPQNPGWVVQQPLSNGGGWKSAGSDFWGNPDDGGTDSLQVRAYDYSYSPIASANIGTGGTLFVFGPETVSDNSSASHGVLSHIEALNGDIINVKLGEEVDITQFVDGQTQLLDAYYRAVKPVHMLAGGDIVNTVDLILNDDPTDITMIAASGNVIFANVRVAGPGTLEVTAGKSLYQAAGGSIESIGPLVEGDKRPGADIAMLAGVGPGAPSVGQVDYTGFATRYLDPANQDDPSLPLADQPGKVAQTYAGQLDAWLQQRFGYDGAQQDALSYFLALPAEQQRVFLRTVYFDELNAAGLEYNDPASTRFGSYLRGREAIATLFPGIGPNTQDNPDGGDITMFGGSGVRTDFGGTIQTLTPAGQTIVGVEGQTPPSTAGVVTQGTGDIDMYADDSILLGQSRVFTTFGGDVLAWSATGDINAGRGSKTTLVYTPSKRIYDAYGNVTLSPTVPSTGAGFATLDPIPDVPTGDMNLVAPLGTIDAGEAGIRVSGNLNIAALHVVNTANIQVQGKSTGIPVVAAVNTGALTAASSAASAVTQMAQQQVARNAGGGGGRHWIITVQVEGFGDSNGGDGDTRKKRKTVPTGYDASSPVSILGFGELGDGQRAALTKEEKQAVGGI
jgi:filamentous hemagglutinin family protein